MELIKKHWKIALVVLVGLIAIGVALGFAFSAPTVGDAAGTSLMLKLFIVAIGFSTMFVFLRIADALSGIHFKAAFDTIETNPLALSIYLGLRWLGAGVFLGSVLG